jgi:hypothetical protein
VEAAVEAVEAVDRQVLKLAVEAAEQVALVAN